MKNIVLSLGGSLIVPDEIQAGFLKQFAELIRSRKDGYRFVIFVGGGSTARKYMEGASEAAQLTDEQRDWLGIHASHLNAHLLKMIFGADAAEKVINDPTQPVAFENLVTVGAGWKPGWSTDYDAVQVAASNGIDRVVNLSNIKYVYDADPKDNPEAKPIMDIAWPEFRKIVGNEWKPGLSMPFDPIAAKLAEEKGIEVVIADGTDIDNIGTILDGKEFSGTLIHS
ncbi:MAG: UMP kinase [Candidatus Kerfeldbacteria bacterium]